MCGDLMVPSPVISKKSRYLCLEEIKPKRLSGALIWMGAISLCVFEAYILGTSAKKDKLNAPVALTHGGILLILTFIWAWINCLERKEKGKNSSDLVQPLVPNPLPQFLGLDIVEKNRKTLLAFVQLVVATIQLIGHFSQERIAYSIFNSTYALPISASANILMGLIVLCAVAQSKCTTPCKPGQR